jgi:hypothetical protein
MVVVEFFHSSVGEASVKEWSVALLTEHNEDAVFRLAIHNFHFAAGMNPKEDRGGGVWAFPNEQLIGKTTEEWLYGHSVVVASFHSVCGRRLFVIVVIGFEKRGTYFSQDADELLVTSGSVRCVDFEWQYFGRVFSVNGRQVPTNGTFGTGGS